MVGALYIFFIIFLVYVLVIQCNLHEKIIQSEYENNLTKKNLFTKIEVASFDDVNNIVDIMGS